MDRDANGVLSKVCKKRGGTQPLDAFYRATAMKDGHRNECKECMRGARRRHYEANRDAYIRKAQDWKRRNPERYRQLEQKRRAARGPEEIRRDRDQHLSRQYSITMDDFDFMVIAQRGLCAICGKEDGIRLHVDHDHATGRVRGLLCGSCNRAMGLFHEDPVRFEAAGAYLRRSQFPLGTGDRQRRPARKVRRSPKAPTSTEQLS